MILAPPPPIIVKDDVFAPLAVTVKKGTTVTWKWRGKHKHNVAVAKGPATFRSKPRKSGSYSKKLTKPGTYMLLCTIHAPDMKMTLIVK